MNEPPKRRKVRFAGVVSRLVLAALIWGAVWVLINPDRAFPPGWNPSEPLHIADPVTPLTHWKLRHALSDPALCRSVLRGAAEFSPLSDKTDSETCHIRNRVDLAVVGQTELSDVETTCAIALRMAMWEQHGLQPAAKTILGSRLVGIGQIGSYNCRAIRTTSGDSSKMSTHATAEAMDIAGFQTADGQSISILRDWTAENEKAQFLRAARDSACDWFRVTLSPDYNALHADHFHLQSVGWGLCR